MKFAPAKRPLTGETLDSLTAALRAHGEPAFRAKQILDWLYKKRARSWDEMTNLSKPLRAWLAETFDLMPASLVLNKQSQDVTDKLLLELRDHSLIETVIIRAPQEGVGLEVVTDGEFRRRSWYQDFVLALGGTKIAFVDASQTISAALPFQDEKGAEKLPGHLVQVDGKLRRDGAIFGDAFAFLKKTTKVTPKVSIPSPTMLHFWGGRQVIDRGAYPDLDAFWSDLVDIYLAEI